MYPTPKKFCTDPKKIAEAGDILISVRAPVGATNLCTERSCIGRGIAAIRPRGINRDFLYFYLKKIESYIDSLGTGVIFKAINKSQLSNLLINKAGFSLPEQKKIAHVLSTVQRAIEAQKKIIRITTELKKALMHKLFTEGTRGEPRKETEIGLIPRSWKVCRIGDSYSFTKKPRDLTLKKHGNYIPFCKMEQIPNGKVYVSKFTKKSVTNLGSGTYIENGDMIIAKITPSFENGKQAIVGIETDVSSATTEVIAHGGIAGVSDNSFLVVKWIKPDVRSKLAGKMEGSTGRQRLSKSVFGDTLIPKPSLEEQKEIARVFLMIQ